MPSIYDNLSKLGEVNLPWRIFVLTANLLIIINYWFFPLSVRTVNLTLAALAFCVCFLYFERFLKVYAHPREPPLIPHRIPYIGHIIGMFRYGAKYFEIVNEKTNYPIYTLRTLTARNIIVISPALAATIQRSSRSLSFYSMILEVTKRLVAFNEPTMEIIRDNVNGEDGDYGLMPESHAMVASVLSPGPVLNSMSSIQLEKFSELLGAIAPGSTTHKTSLMTFVKDVFTKSNAYAIYGPQNPFAVHPGLTRDFWVYEDGMIPVMADVMPQITARKAYQARKRILSALQEFVETEAYKKASPLIQKRVAINLKHGLTTKMAGHAELILLFGIVGNAVPTTFWLLANIFARPDLLSEIRSEVSKAVSTTAKNEKTISVEILKTACPLLISTYRETLRTIANLSSVRYVLSDTVISGYLLKKGSIVQIASGVIHADEEVWGRTAKEFQPRRFMSSSSNNAEQFSSETGTRKTEGAKVEYTATQLPRNVPSAAYRAFGGGSVICPGRHFAQSEIVGFAALVVSAFDITSENRGAIELPQKDDTRIPLSVMKPVKEPMVKIKRRKGEEGVKWRLEL